MRAALRVSLLFVLLHHAAAFVWGGNPRANRPPLAASTLPALSPSSSAGVTGTFRNTLLVVHCRLKAKDALRDEGICQDRLHLYHGYRQYFAEVLYITRQECPIHGDPHLCVARIMQGPGASRDGVFYMHFDSLIRPRHLAATFKKNHLASFNEAQWCEINKTTLEQEHCDCAFWDSSRASAYQHAIAGLRNSGTPEFADLDEWQFWTGNDDMFYVPRRFYYLYGLLAEAFEFIQHEIAGPTMRWIMEKAKSVPMLNMNCTGSCCTQLSGEIVMQSDFKCGHAFDLSVRKTRVAFPKAISTYRSREVPLEDWSAVLQAALA